MDSILVANEIIEEMKMKMKKKSYVCFKVDYEKAYDCVRFHLLYVRQAWLLRKVEILDKGLLGINFDISSSQ